MAITPDTKNWTWVLDEVCPECRFDAASVDLSIIGDLIRANAALWPPLLAASNAGERPSPVRWSALEYGCHVRDVFALYDQRLALMLAEDGARFADWNQDTTSVEQRYDLQAPAIVAAELVAAGELCAARFDTVGDGDWQRTGNRSDGSRFTIETFARYFLHDPVHHVHDVERGNELLASSSVDG
jgi:hypothetical protein